MLRELFQLAALFLVSSLELLMLHSEPLLLQHDLLVQTAQRSGIKSAESCKFRSKRQALGDVVSYSCSSVISFSLASSSSLRLLICLWWASLWVWICFSTASWRHGKKQLVTAWDEAGNHTLHVLQYLDFICRLDLVLFLHGINLLWKEKKWSMLLGTTGIQRWIFFSFLWHKQAQTVFFLSLPCHVNPFHSLLETRFKGETGITWHDFQRNP